MPNDFDKKLREIRKNRDVSFFDLCSIDDLTDADVKLLFDLARGFRESETHKFKLGEGISMANVFFEGSTRTMSSFTLAGMHLGMDVVSLSQNSSVKKGETYLDTLETLAAYHVKAFAIRSSEAGLHEKLKPHTPAAIVNAGDGWHEHPTQGLLDALTMVDHVGKDSLKGTNITVIGDIRHSRVWGSLVRIINKLGGKITLCAPETLLPDQVEKFGIKVETQVEKAIKGADIVYCLRVQEERGAKGFVPNLKEYAKTYCLTEERFNLAKKGAIFMHPGPVIRNVDVHTSLVARHPQSRILRQVENGMAIRKAILWCVTQRFDGKEKPYELF